MYGKTAAVYVEQAYSLKGKSRTVDAYGLTIRNELPISSGSHFGFDIPQFSRRRVQVGDAWETSIPLSLQWAVEKPTIVRGSARLDAFEWEDHYPTAKIVENYEGPATIAIEAVGAEAVPPVQNVNVKLTRIVWFAYGLGRVVRETSDMKVDGNFTAAQAGALGAGGLTASGGLNPEIARLPVRRQILLHRQGGVTRPAISATRRAQARTRARHIRSCHSMLPRTWLLQSSLINQARPVRLGQGSRLSIQPLRLNEYRKNVRSSPNISASSEHASCGRHVISLSAASSCTSRFPRSSDSSPVPSWMR